MRKGLDTNRLSFYAAQETVKPFGQKLPSTATDYVLNNKNLLV